MVFFSPHVAVLYEREDLGSVKNTPADIASDIRKSSRPHFGTNRSRFPNCLSNPPDLLKITKEVMF